MLLAQFHALLDRGWRLAFPQARTHERAVEHAIASLCVFGRRTISRSLAVLGRSDCDWSADYKMFSRGLRASLDQRGGSDRSLLIVGDGSFANQTMFKAPLERTELLARCRKDARLCFPAPAGQRRKCD